MFNERNTFVICETLKKFQKKISSFQIHHNLAEENDREASRNLETEGDVSGGGGGHRKTACPQAVHLLNLIKALRHCKSIKIVCNPDSYPLVHDTAYKQLAFALTRSSLTKSRRS